MVELANATFAPQTTFATRQSRIVHGDSMQASENWPRPTCILVDGPYGVGGYAGDPRAAEGLGDWYEPHISVWTKRATATTTLWFWNTEIGWATVHPILAKFGWQYRGCNIWNKGTSHVAGNVNTATMRKFPVVTEVCAHYVRPATFMLNDGVEGSMQSWLRHEWRRSGLPWRDADKACGVKSAATRKYLTADALWYCPPKEKLELLAAYANEHGDATGRPYFDIGDSKESLNTEKGTGWSQLRGKFQCPFGVTNVWSTPHVEGTERIKGRDGKPLHPCQKPLALMRLLVECSTDVGDVVWEPFGGLCPGAVVCEELERRYFGAEIDLDYFAAASHRAETSMVSGNLFAA